MKKNVSNFYKNIFKENLPDELPYRTASIITKMKRHLINTGKVENEIFIFIKPIFITFHW